MKKNKIQGTFPVIKNTKISGRFYHLVIDAPAIARQTRAGQFVHIRVTDGLEPLFRRPFSVFRAQKYLEIFYEPVGKGTQIMASLKKGDTLDVLGPLGNTFSLPDKRTKNVVMIAGGIGVAPFLLFSDELKKKNLGLTLLYGGRDKDCTFSMAAFKKNGCAVHVATDDGSVGVKGRVSKLFDRIPVGGSTMLYTCGPRPMMAAVQEFARKHELKGEAACEEVMACGLGACLGCAVPTKSGYKTVCHDGPVFDLDEVIFDR